MLVVIQCVWFEHKYKWKEHKMHKMDKCRNTFTDRCNKKIINIYFLITVVKRRKVWQKARREGGVMVVFFQSNLFRYGDFYHKDKMVLRLPCLVHPGVRDKCRVSEIHLSQPRHETAFRWRHNGSVTSQLTDPIKWPNYPLELIGIYVHINTHNKEFLQQRCHRSKNVRLCLIYSYISIWFES